MTTFKKYLERNRTPMLTRILSWDSGFRDIESPVSEEKTERTNVDKWGSYSNRGKKTNSQGATYDAGIHDHADVKPKRLKHAPSVQHYTTTPSEDTHGAGSSKNINGYLRNKMGDKTVGVLHHSHADVHEAIKKLSSNFTPENTNRKAVTTYSGIPDHIGDKLEKSKAGDIHHLAGFTSTSTATKTATDFATQSASIDSVRHVIQFHVKPGAGLSVASKSKHPENEVLLHHGARIEYSHTVSNVGKSHGGSRAKNIETRIHHVIVHPDHLKLDSYGSYDHPN